MRHKGYNRQRNWITADGFIVGRRAIGCQIIEELIRTNTQRLGNGCTPSGRISHPGQVAILDFWQDRSRLRDCLKQFMQNSGPDVFELALDFGLGSSLGFIQPAKLDEYCAIHQVGARRDVGNAAKPHGMPEFENDFIIIRIQFPLFNAAASRRAA